ncbi:MAG TPA: SNF2 helicase-associated domain-containing protein [Phototrophicaceae bacterium]|nr:SNF2 helicase-associated domain-containing protein [Phototrophicaceae bacterium]
MLLTLAQQKDTGRSLHFWRAAALVSRQQVLPALENNGFRYRAFWQALPEQPERLTELAAQMPPLCGALAETPDTAPVPYPLLATFIGEVVDSTIREAAAHLPPPSTRGADAAWWSALTTADPILRLPTSECESVFKAWQSWAGQSDAAGNSAFHITFRLDAPEGEDCPGWQLDYLLQATDDPSLIVSASQIWSGHGDRYLQQRFDQPQERLLHGLAFAGRLFTPILNSLHSVAPASSIFDTGQAYTFLQEAAPLLQASGFRVLLPCWWAKHWLAVLDNYGIGSRLQRGRSYARSGQVLNLDILPSLVMAQVQGSSPKPYDVEIKVRPLPDSE